MEQLKQFYAKSDALVFSNLILIDTKVPLPKNPSWFDVLGVEEDDIKDCCYRIMCLYDRKKVCLNIREHILKTFKTPYTHCFVTHIKKIKS